MNESIILRSQRERGEREKERVESYPAFEPETEGRPPKEACYRCPITKKLFRQNEKKLDSHNKKERKYLVASINHNAIRFPPEIRLQIECPSLRLFSIYFFQYNPANPSFTRKNSCFLKVERERYIELHVKKIEGTRGTTQLELSSQLRTTTIMIGRLTRGPREDGVRGVWHLPRSSREG